jgi:SH3 domain-containing protein
MLALLAIASALPAQAAPPGQQITPEPTLNPSHTPIATATTGRVPNQGTPAVITPPTGATPTLLPPPAGGGRVAAEALYVRAESSFDAPVIGVIAYNQSVYPVGRNANNTWVAIKWSDGTGWIYAGLVVWDSNFDFNSLPIMAPANLTPLPSDTPTEAVSPTAGTAEAETVTSLPSPSATAAPTDTATPRPRPTPSATAVPVSPAPTATTISAAAPPPAGNPLDALPPDVKTGGIIAVGLLVAAGGAYSVRRIVAQREVTRYRGGFPLTLCPVCLEGHVNVDEIVKVSLGIPRLTRWVRCNNCRSVLREVQPGRWRYAVDSYRNPEMAEKYKTHLLNLNDLNQLAEYATEERFKIEVDKEQTLKSELDLSWLDVDYGDGSAGGAETPLDESETEPDSAEDEDDEPA